MALVLAIAIFAISSQAIAGDLTVEIQNRKSKSSQILCSLFTQAEGFPNDKEKSEKSVEGEAADDKTVCKFKDINDGEIAVSVLEDLNGNGKMDKSSMGIPKEPWGVSKNAPAHKFGPPKFNEAKFKLSGDSKIEIKLNR